MEFRCATVEDSPAMEAFLLGHADTSMFLRANLRNFGPCGGDDRNATRMWLQETDGVLSGILGITTAGFVLMQLPGQPSVAGVAQVLGGERVNGMIGAAEQVAVLRDALGLANADLQLDEDEPLYSIDLNGLEVPDGATDLRHARDEDRVMLEDWRRAYLMESLHFSEADAAQMAGADIDGMMRRGSMMLLEQPDGTPVAMTSFNAILPDMVQIGNVFTPGRLRGRGFARRAVALHLRRAFRDGVQRAILFASGPAASRAYEAIGFRRIGNFTLLFLAAPHVVKAAA